VKQSDGARQRVRMVGHTSHRTCHDVTGPPAGAVERRGGRARPPSAASPGGERLRGRRWGVPGTTARPSVGSPRYDREASAGISPVRPRGRRRGVPGTTARPSAGSPRSDREAVGGESPVRPRGRRRGVPGTTARPSAGSPRYDREAVGNPSQTATVRERVRPTTLPVVVRKRGRLPGRGGVRIPRWEGVVGRAPALTGWGLALVTDASRSYRGYPHRRLAVAPLRARPH